VNERSGRRCAVVYNPIKMSDDLRDAITRHAKEGKERPDRAGDPADNPGQVTTAENRDRVIAVGTMERSGLLRTGRRNLVSRWPWCRWVPETCWPATWRSHCRLLMIIVRLGGTP
jgi:hypothetical protein